jgi:hypothetical protein
MVEASLDQHLVMPRDERPPQPRRYRARRWIAKRILDRLSICTRPRTRYQKVAENQRGLVQITRGHNWLSRNRRRTGSRLL